MNQTHSTLVFKLATAGEWRTAQSRGSFTGSPDDVRDGFIHFSAAHQVEATARKYFGGIGDLVLIAFRTADLGPALRWEPSRGGADFPHFYEPLPAGAALWVHEVTLDPSGIPIVPLEILTLSVLPPQHNRVSSKTDATKAAGGPPRTDEQQT